MQPKKGSFIRIKPCAEGKWQNFSFCLFGQVLPSAAGCSHPRGHPANTAPGDLWALLDEMVLLIQAH